MSCGKTVTGTEPTTTTAGGLPAPQDTESAQAVVEAMETRIGVAEGLASMERGNGEPAEVVFDRLRKKHEFKTK